MALRPTLKWMLVALAALLAAGATAVLAAGSSGDPARASAKAAVRKAAAPKTMHVACAHGTSGKLQYLPAGTKDCSGQLIHFPKDGPVTACQLDKGNSQIYEAQAKLAPPAHHHAVTGMLFVVSGPGKCHAPKYPDSHPRTLPPATKDLRLCAGKRRGTVRVVNHFADCNELEFAVVLEHFNPNHRPTANPQSVDVDEDSSKAITLTGSDPDGDALHFAIASAPAHGTLTGTGAHRSYHPNPNYTGPDSFRFTVSDGHGASDSAKVSITVHGADDAPVVLTSPESTDYTENAAAVAVDPAVEVSDPDDASLAGATVAVTAGFQAGDKLEFKDQSGIGGSYDSSTGVLTLTGTAPVADYQAALRSIGFSSTSDDPSAEKTVEFTVSDGDRDSGAAPKHLLVQAVNDPPTDTPDSDPPIAYTEGDGAQAIFADIVLADPDSPKLAGASIAFTQHYHQGEDQLAFSDQNGIAGNWNPTTGVLSLTGSATVADYQAAIRSITYEDTSSNPATDQRRIDAVVDDGSSSHNLSDGFDREIDVTATNTKPTVTTSSGATSVSEDSASAIDPALTVSDPDSANLQGATVRISSGFQSGDDLVFVDTATITGVYNTGTGVLTLTGTDTVAHYQDALRSVKFQTTNDNPSSSKTVGFVASDGDKSSGEASKSLSVTGVNDAPTLSTSSGSASFTENGSPATVDPNVSVSDPDSTNLSGAKVQVTSNFSAADGDTLSFTNTANITGSYNASTGVLTLSGTDTLAAYVAALRSVTFSNSSDNPSTATRTVSFQVSDDGALSSNTDTRDVTVAVANDAPVVTTSSGSTAYSEGAAAATIDSALTVTDPDDTNLEGATVRISSGFQAGDDLVFVNTATISGLYNTGTGVLTLTGTDTVAHYQDALRSIKFQTTNDNPSSSKTVGFTANDGDADSAEAFKSIAVTGVNDAPSLATSSGSASFTENGSPATVDPNVSVSDPDSTNLSAAKVQVTSNFSSADGDTLSFTNTANITGSYNASTGVLTLSGTDTLANYQAALRSVTFSNTSDNPSTATRTVSFQVTDDGALSSNTDTRDVHVAQANDAPVVTTSSGSTAYTEGAAAATIDGSLTVTDPDDTNLEGATVRISSGFQAGDDLVFINTATISGLYNTGTGVLTLSGTDTLAHYQDALRSIKFQTTNDNPSGSKTVGFTANDGDADSAEAFKSIAVTPVNDAPTLTTSTATASYTENGSPATVDPNLTVDDPDDTNLEGATIELTTGRQTGDALVFTDTANITGSFDSSTGVLTLSGTDTLAGYQAALRSIQFQTSNDNPTTPKTVAFKVNDGDADSNTATRDVAVTPANDAPTVTTSTGSTSYSEGDPATTIDSGVTVSDPDDTNLEGATVSVSTGFQSGDDLVFVNTANISGVYNTGTGVLTLSGTDTVANYQAALRSISFVTTSDNPSSKTIGFVANDGSDDSSEAFKGIDITGVNDAPTVNTSASDLTYTEGDGAVAVDDALTLTDPDSTQIQGATVAISGNFASADDELGFTNTAKITGVYDDSTGVLSLTGTDTVANYQAALRSVTYTSLYEGVSSFKTISFKATDAEGADSNVADRTVDLENVNDPPVVTTTSGSTAYTENGPAVPVDSGVTISDVDDADLHGATISITSGFQAGDDLQFTDTANIVGSYNSTTGVLILNGTDSVANYQAALRSIKFASTNDAPSTPKTVSFTAKDSDASSDPATKDLAVTPVNDAPTVTTTATNLSYTEGDGPKAADPGVTVSDPDSTNLSGAKVSITANFSSTDDTLAFTDTPNITGSYNSSTGVLTLSGTATVADYQAALRSVTYSNSSQNPSGTKTVSFQATDDGALASNTATRTVDLTGVNDAPVVATSSGNDSYTEGDTAITVDSAVTVSDVDDTNLESADVRISNGFQAGDVLQFTAPGGSGISGNYNPTTGVLTLSGTSSLANYQSTLRSVKYVSTNPAPFTSKTVSFKANDGDADSNAATKDIDVTPVNSPPTVDATDTALTFTENDPQTPVDSGLTITEPEGDSLSGGSAEITSNYQSSEDALTWTDNDMSDLIQKDLINSTNSKIVLIGVGSAAQYQAALRAVKFANGSENPSSLQRTVTFSASDQFTTTGSDTRALNVVPVDDPPVAVNDSASLTEDDPATAVAVLSNDTDIDGGPKEITAFSDPANGTVVGTGGSANHWTGLTYQPDPNYCNKPPDTTPDTFTYTLNGGSQATVSVHVTCVNDAPVANDETFSGAVGNTTLVGNDPSDGAPATPDPTDTAPASDRPHNTISADIMANDTDVDSPSSGFTVTAGTFSTADGGTVTIQSDGDFTFEPKASTSCTDHQDSFDYTLNDNDALGNKTDTGTVTINITGCVWYVNNDDAQGDSGTSEKPFDTLAEAQTASGSGDSIFVYDGNNSTTGYNAGIDLKQNQQLIGEAADLVVSSTTLHTADSSNRPTLTDTADNVVNLGSGNTIKGLSLDPQGGGGISGASGDAGGTIDNVDVTDTTPFSSTGPGLGLVSTSGTWNISNFSVTNGDGSSATTADKGIVLSSAGTVNFASSGTISINTNGARGLDSSGTNMGLGSVFDGITVTNSGDGGVSLSSDTGTTQLGDGSGTDLALTTTSGSPAALNISSTSNVSVPAGGTADVHATGGPAVNVGSASALTGVNLDLDDVDSTNSAGSGISLVGLGAGTFSAQSGDITGAAGTSFLVNGGSGKVSYPGNIGNGSGTTAVNVTGRSGGTGVNGVTLSGTISDTNDLGGTIDVSSNTGGDVTMSGATKQANTTGPSSNGTADGVLFNSNSNTSLTLSGGGLDIDTIGGKGLESSNTSGTLQVTGSGNTIDTTTGRGVNIANTTIGASGVTFQHVTSGTASAGPTNGMTLNNTGTTGTFTVTGDGTNNANASGGTIQKSGDGSSGNAGDGIRLTGSHQVSLRQMDIKNTGDSGIYDDGGPLDLAYMNVTNSGTESVVPGDNSSPGLTYVNNIGTSSVANSTVTGSQNNNLDWKPTSGTGTLTATSDNFDSAGNVGVQVNPQTGSTANITFNMTGGTARFTPAEEVGITAGGASTVHSTISNVNMASTFALPANFGVEFNSFQTGHLLAKLDGSTIKYAGSDAASAITMTQDDTANTDVTITNNTIGTPGTNPADADSGTIANFGISALFDGDTTNKLDIENNSIAHVESRGIHLRAHDFSALAGSSNNQLTIKNNTIYTPDMNTQGLTHANGILLEDEQTNTMCADVTGNKSAHFGTGSTDTDIRVRQLDTSTFQLEGFGGNGADDAAVAAFLVAQNPLNSSNTTTTAAAQHTTSFTSSAGCTMPTAP